MDKLKDISLVLSIIGGTEKVIEILHSAYMHKSQIATLKEQEATYWKEKHDKLAEEHEKLKQANPSLDAHKDVLV
jgi:phosphoribosyl-AMP cyclohydrolase